MKILFCYGTRPELIKILPLASKTPNSKTFCTGQHTDLLSSSFVPDYKLKIEPHHSSRLNSIFSVLLDSQQLEEALNECTHVLIQGDTASAFACALAAFNKDKKVIHLEAGLRTYSRNHPYPEEIYRQCISRLADVNLCPTTLSKSNLMTEKVAGHTFVVGNTALDNLINLETSYNTEVLVTLHRRENHPILDKWFIEIEKTANKNASLSFVFISHPNPNVQKHLDVFKKVKVINPLDHGSFIKRMAECRFLITDSGGLQEEASFLNKKIIVCRRYTERPEGLYTFSHLCKKPEELVGLVDVAKSNYRTNAPSPFGDGKAVEKILQVL